MSNAGRRIRKQRQSRLDRLEHADAMKDVQRWERGLQQHFHVAVGRLRMARMKQAPAELAAYRAIVKALQGREEEIGVEDVPGEFEAKE